MKRINLFLKTENPAIRAVVLEAAEIDFPQAKVTDVKAIADIADDSDHMNLLILGEPDDEILAQATQAVDADGCPRWAVVVLGEGSSELAEVVSPEDWNARCLARVLHSAVLQHELVQENTRLRGDLKTMDRRINHELRSPLSCIYTSSDLLEEMAPQGMSPKEMAGVFRQSSSEIAELIDRVSFMIRASMDPVLSEPVAMGEIVDSVLKELECSISRAKGSVVLPDLWPEVTGVRKWLNVVWWNLLHNAVQHGGPEVRIRITWSRENDNCRFAVWDEGGGVGPEEQSALFVPFEKLHGVRTAGLGLSIVQRLVALQKGRCGYESVSPSGACFYFTLPAA